MCAQQLDASLGVALFAHVHICVVISGRESARAQIGVVSTLCLATSVLCRLAAGPRQDAEFDKVRSSSAQRRRLPSSGDAEDVHLPGSYSRIRGARRA